MVLNQGKCHFMSLGKNTENQTFVYKNKIKKTNEEQKVFGIIIDDKLTFKSRVKNFSKKTSQKIWALASLSRYLDDTKGLNIRIGNKISITLLSNSMDNQ